MPKKVMLEVLDQKYYEVALKVLRTFQRDYEKTQPTGPDHWVVMSYTERDGIYAAQFIVWHTHQVIYVRQAPK